jgi:glycerol-3-phosphate acyltransferase PlsX
LLSTGAEEGKGNELVREGYHLLKDSGVNFVGNVEGSDILTGKANVVVCDGFVGNVLLKFYESIGEYALGWMRHKLRRHPPLSWMVKLAFDRVLPIAKLSYEGEEAGSGILWGVNGIVRVAHGACRASHIAHGIAGAKKAVMADIIGILKPELERFKREGKL